jgi:hypothetical protein
MKKLLTAIAGAAMAATTLVAVPTSATAAPYCGLVWGSLAERSTFVSTTATVRNVRAGQHTCYDRLVIDLRGNLRGYDVRYVTAVYTEGQGLRVPLLGAADLRIIVNAPSYNINTGASTYSPSNRYNIVNVAGYRTFRQAAFLGSFEGQSSFGLGVRARLPFRTFLVKDATTTRLVIDVAHRW